MHIVVKAQQTLKCPHVQVYSQLGNDSPDVEVNSLKAMYETTQRLLADEHISAGHDVSDGGIAVALMEAAFAGNCGIQVDYTSYVGVMTSIQHVMLHAPKSCVPILYVPWRLGH